jgi:hypothetical protein
MKSVRSHRTSWNRGSSSRWETSSGGAGDEVVEADDLDSLAEQPLLQVRARNRAPLVTTARPNRDGTQLRFFGSDRGEFLEVVHRGGAASNHRLHNPPVPVRRRVQVVPVQWLPEVHRKPGYVQRRSFTGRLVRRRTTFRGSIPVRPSTARRCGPRMARKYDIQSRSTSRQS